MQTHWVPTRGNAFASIGLAISELPEAAAHQKQTLRQNKQFQLLWIGSVASALGSNISTLAFPLLVLGLTESPAMAGIVTAVGLASDLIFTLPAGVWADRWDRRRVLLTCETTRALLVASVAIAAYLDCLTVVHIIVVAATEDAAGTLFSPARELTIRSVVRPEHLTAAYSQEHARAQAAELAGQPIGGFLFTISNALPFVADAISYVASMVCIWFAKVPRYATGVDEHASGKSMRADIAEAVRWLRSARLLQAICCVSLVTNLGSSMFFVPLIVLVEERGGTPATLGIVMGAASVGGLLGAMTATRVAAAIPLNRLLLLVCVVSAGLTVAVVAPFGPFWPAVPIFLSGVFGPWLAIPIQVYIIRNTPEAMMARVQAVVGVMFSALMPVGPVFSGFLTQGVGAAWAIAATASTFALSAVGILCSASLRHPPPTF